MATSARSSGLFSGLVLISVGLLVLLHNYGHLDLHGFFGHWWPLLIIFWGAVKLFERTAGRRFGGSDGGRVSGREAGLVVAMGGLGAVGALDDRPKMAFGPGPQSGDSSLYLLAGASRLWFQQSRVL